eukprot:COSAG01_NODE_66832_length_268_cov_174.213018_1_plen_82_part_10
MPSECTPSIFLTTAPVDTSISDAVLSKDVKHNVVPSGEKHDDKMTEECTPSIFLTTAPVDTSISDAVLSKDAKHNVVPSGEK